MVQYLKVTTKIYKLNHVFMTETETPFKVLRPNSNKCAKHLRTGAETFRAALQKSKELSFSIAYDITERKCGL